MTQEAFIKAYRALPNFRVRALLYMALSYCHQYCQEFSGRSGTSPPGNDVDAETMEQLDVGIRLKEHATPESHLLTEEIARTVRQALLMIFLKIYVRQSRLESSKD